MMDAYRQIGQYIRHWHRSANSKGHGVHSPFLFDFITRVLPDTGHGPQFSFPETYRKELLSDRTGFSRVELGGGSRLASKTITVQSVAKRSLQTARWSRLLYRILHQYQPGSVLELGTSFGVTTQYCRWRLRRKLFTHWKGIHSSRVKHRSVFEGMDCRMSDWSREIWTKRLLPHLPTCSLWAWLGWMEITGWSPPFGISIKSLNVYTTTVGWCWMTSIGARKCKRPGIRSKRTHAFAVPSTCFGWALYFFERNFTSPRISGCAINFLPSAF